jgi:hypothetical protein
MALINLKETEDFGNHKKTLDIVIYNVEQRWKKFKKSIKNDFWNSNLAKNKTEREWYSMVLQMLNSQ